MKKLLLLLSFALVFAGCQKETQKFPEIDIPEEVPTDVSTFVSIPTPVPTTLAPSLAHSKEEALAQAMEYAANYKIDVYDVRLFHENLFGLPLKPDSGYPTIVVIIEFLQGRLTPAEEQLVWEAAKAGMNNLSTSITGWHYFFTHSGSLLSGVWCPAEMLEASGVGDKQICVDWPGVAPLPPEMLRFIGF